MHSQLTLLAKMRVFVMVVLFYGLLSSPFVYARVADPWLTQEAHSGRASDRAKNNTMAGSELIAYVASSRDRQSIRLVKPDGTGDRMIFQVPTGTAPIDAINFVAWHSDATELAFDSGHDWQRSLLIRDLYSIAPDGTGLRRLTRPPSPIDASSKPTGTVTFVLDSYASGDVQLYIEGAANPLSFQARLGTNYQITKTLHDLGENVRQWIRLWDPDPLDPPCNFNEAAWVHVVPGQLTDAGVIAFSVVDDYSCPKATAPAWLYQRDELLYLFAEADTVYQDDNNLWQISNNAPVTTMGNRVLDYGQYVSEGRLFWVAPGRSPSTANQLLAGVYDAYTFVFTAPLDDPGQRQFLDLGTCPATLCTVVGLAWLPDGSGFLFSRFEKGRNGSTSAIYRYTFADQTIDEIFRITNQIIGRLDASPDGSSIVFERDDQLDETLDYFWLKPLLLCPCQLWIVEIDGSNARMVVSDGRAPAWSPVAIPDQATPTPTSTPPPTPTSSATPVGQPTQATAYLPLIAR